MGIVHAEYAKWKYILFAKVPYKIRFYGHKVDFLSIQDYIAKLQWKHIFHVYGSHDVIFIWYTGCKVYQNQSQTWRGALS